MWTKEQWYQDAFNKTKGNPQYYKDFADYLLDTYKAHLQEMSEDAICNMLIEHNRKRLDAVPDLNIYPELRGMDDLIAAERRGIQDGGGLSDIQLAAWCDGMFMYRSGLVGAANNMSLGCSAIYFPESDCGPLLAVNLDSSPDEPFEAPIWVPLNEHIIIAKVSSGIYNDEKSSEIFPAPVLKLLARYCRTTEEAVEMLELYNDFWGPANWLVMDQNKKTAMIEKSNCRIGVRWSDDGFGFVTAMTAEEPSFRKYLLSARDVYLKEHSLGADSPDQAYWDCADQRRELITELIDEAKAEPTLEKLRQIIQFRDEKRGKVCYNGETIHPDGPPVEHTIRTAIWLLREGQVIWWAKDGDTPSFKNRKENIIFKDVLKWN